MWEVGRFIENSCMKTAFSCTLNAIIRGSVWEVGRFIENSCMKTAFSCTLNAIIRGSLREVAYTNPLLPPF